MQDSTKLGYILSLVEQDISILESQRIDILERSGRDINHGQLLALAKLKGRLGAMIEAQSLDQQIRAIINQ